MPNTTELVAAADAMRDFLRSRTEALAGCVEGSEEEAELRAIADAVEAYEVQRGEDRPEGGS